jgi:hypothetical protein
VRRGLTWLFVLPAIVVGSQVAHGLAYWWAYPQAHLRVTELAYSGHGYLAYAPAAIAFLAAVQVIAFVVAVLDRVRRRPVRDLPAWVFLFIPQLGFVLQEHVERFVVAGRVPWWTTLEPSFWRGVVLQIPLGIAAYLVALLLLRTASVVAEAVAAHDAAPVAKRRRRTPSPRPQLVFLPRPAPLAGTTAGRAPPLVAA